MRDKFHESLAVLTASLAGLADCCERAVEASVRALTEGDPRAIAEAVQLEAETDRLAGEVEGLCLRLLMTQQPVASDLRLIGAAMKMSTDLERIGDQCADIAALCPLEAGEIAPMVREMGAICCAMLRDAVAAYDQWDVDLARTAAVHDDAVDRHYAATKSAIAAMQPAPLDLFLCVKYYERIGDHAQNVAEWVEYALDGIYRGREL